MTPNHGSAAILTQFQSLGKQTYVVNSLSGVYMWEYGVFKLTKMYLPDVYSSSVHVLEYTQSHLFARSCVGILLIDTIEIIQESQWLIYVSSITSMSSVYILVMGRDLAKECLKVLLIWEASHWMEILKNLLPGDS